MVFLIDAQLSPKLKQFFSERGHDAYHVFDAGVTNISDSQIWQMAIEMEAVIVTKDEDFAVRRIVSKSGPAIIWLRCRNCTNYVLVTWLVSLWPLLNVRLSSGDALIELI